MRTVVYIDGFNLYYRALKGTRHKWLDIVALSRAALPSTCNVIRVNYYTARVWGAPIRICQSASMPICAPLRPCPRWRCTTGIS